MERSEERHLEVLTVIGEADSLTQRALAQRLGVALGLTNLYLKRLAHKGFIKVVEFPRKPKARRRLRYLLTPRGLAEKTRLTYQYMDRSLALYRLAPPAPPAAAPPPPRGGRPRARGRVRAERRGRLPRAHGARLAGARDRGRGPDRRGHVRQAQAPPAPPRGAPGPPPQT